MYVTVWLLQVHVWTVVIRLPSDLEFINYHILPTSTIYDCRSNAECFHV